jgi:ketosteroid isomerase-like protein
VSVNDNKALAVRFFEALDTGDIGLLQNIFTEDCVFHRGDLIAPARGFGGDKFDCRKACSNLPRLPNDNTSHNIGEGDLVATRETHEGIHRGQFPTPIGTFDVTGRPIEWTSQVFFRFKGGKIAQMWVARDELGMIRSLGIVLEARQ